MCVRKGEGGRKRERLLRGFKKKWRGDGGALRRVVGGIEREWKGVDARTEGG